MFKRVPFISIMTLLVLTAMLLSACSPFIVINTNARVKGSGNLAREERSVSGFTQIVLNGSGDVTVVLGDRESVIVEAEDNLLKYLETEVQGSQLVIKVASNVQLRPTRPMRFTVTMKSVDGLSIGGSGNITCESLKTDVLNLDLSGSGNIKIKAIDARDLTVDIAGSGSVEVTGEVGSQTVNLSGSGTFRAEDMRASFSDVVISGSGSARVWTEETLSASVSGSGSIAYYGTPDVSKSVVGSGSVNGKGNK